MCRFAHWRQRGRIAALRVRLHTSLALLDISLRLPDHLHAPRCRWGLTPAMGSFRARLQQLHVQRAITALLQGPRLASLCPRDRTLTLPLDRLDTLLVRKILTRLPESLCALIAEALNTPRLVRRFVCPQSLLPVRLRLARLSLPAPPLYLQSQTVQLVPI